MGLTHHPFSALFTILPVQLQHKQLNQQHLTRGNTGKQQWPCPRTVTFSVSNKRKVIPVLEAVTHPKSTDTIMVYQNQKFSALVARYAEDSNVPTPACSVLCQADTVNTTVFVHGSAGFVTYILHDILAAIQYSSQEIPGTFFIYPLFAEGLPRSTTLPYSAVKHK